jgi:hypothetical protein
MTARTPRRFAWRAALAAGAVVGLLASACGDYRRPQAGPPTTTTTTTTNLRPGESTTTTVPGATTSPPTTSPRAAEVAGLPGHLAVITADGSLVTMAPDGTARTTVALPANGVVTQPTWSRDGTRIAFAATRDTVAAVRVASSDAKAVVEQALGTSPTLLAWSPDNARLALERPGAGTAGAPSSTVDVISTSATNAATPVGAGATTAVSWEPNGQRLVVRVGDVISIVDAAGASRTLSLVWVSGNRILVAVKATRGSVLTLVDVDTGARTDLLTFDGTLDMVVDPNGTRVAYRVVLAPSGGGTDQLTSFTQTTPRAQTTPGAPTTSATPPTTAAPAVLPAATPDTLAVLDLAAGATPRVVSPNPVAAFSWSPTGDRLGYLTATGPSTGQWSFWDGTKTLTSSRYAPSTPVLGQYLEDFAKYAATVTTWSPDGKAFVFAGLVANQDGVWIQRIADPMPGPIKVSDGAIALWSPK